MIQSYLSPKEADRSLESPPTPEAVVRPCRHCGEPCREEFLCHGDMAFCCAGCQTVYTILNENGLDDFYRIDGAAGRSQRKLRAADYAWLDEENLARDFIRYADGEQYRVSLEMPQIHCISCVWLLENLRKLHPGVTSVQVHFGRRRADILFRHRAISFRELAELLACIGYPPAFARDEPGEASTKNRRLLYQIGLAGFTFGNVMLLSFPEYLGLQLDLTGGVWSRFFGWLNLGLSVPVLLYSGRDYLLAAGRALRHGSLNIDVPIALGLIALFGRSAYEVISQTGAGYFDSLAGLLFFLLIGRWFQGSTFERLSFDRDFRHYFPVAARRKSKQGGTESVGMDDIVAGDHLLVRPGDLIPADGTLITAATHGIDYSFVTGESQPQTRKAGEVVFAGGRATREALEVIVSRPPDQSYLLQLWREEAGERADRDRNSTDRISRYFTPLILLIALLTFGYWWPVGIDPALRAATAVLIIACPCALALSIPFTYGTLMRVCARRGWYLKGVDAVGRLTEIDTVVLDKTGTLTESGTTVLSVESLRLSASEKRIILAMAEQSAHPKSRLLARYLRAEGVQAEVNVPPIFERPGRGIAVEVDGRWYRIGSVAFCGGGTVIKGDVSSAGAPVPAVAVSVDGRTRATFLAPPPRLRAGVGPMLTRLAAERNLHLLSGDQPNDLPYWRNWFAEERLRFGQSPFAKEEYVADLQKRGRKVMMIGDGLNDAGALRRADVGVAVTEDMANFSPACDAIILADRVNRLPDLFRLIRYGQRVLFCAYGLAFLYNIVGLSFAVRGWLSPVVAAVLMPLSSLSIVAVGVGGIYLVDGLIGKNKNSDIDHRTH